MMQRNLLQKRGRLRLQRRVPCSCKRAKPGWTVMFHHRLTTWHTLPDLVSTSSL